MFYTILYNFLVPIIYQTFAYVSYAVERLLNNLHLDLHMKLNHTLITNRTFDSKLKHMWALTCMNKDSGTDTETTKGHSFHSEYLQQPILRHRFKCCCFFLSYSAYVQQKTQCMKSELSPVWYYMGSLFSFNMFTGEQTLLFTDRTVPVL